MSDLLTEFFREVIPGATPNSWQRRLYQTILHDERLPRSIRVPTSGGKTAILIVYLAALASQSLQGKISLPRRIVMVINRRALVDQATSLAEAIKSALETESLLSTRQALSALSASRKPLAISTLRGEFADNGEWSLDPSTPAIILGTPDMIGSRLLFCGYGNGKVKRAQHAGLLGIDTLIVHDEAHLSPTFGCLLTEIAELAAQSAIAVGRPPLQIAEMTATSDQDDCFVGMPDIHAPEDVDLLRRLHAPKTLSIEKLPGIAPAKPGDLFKWEANQRKLAAQRMADMAELYKESGDAIAIFLDRPEHVGEVVDVLLNSAIASEHIAVLTGTMRAYERDRVTESPAFRRFLPNHLLKGTGWLICTSAGEIGLDIDADRIFCDLVSLDRLIQRFGRGNRKGRNADCSITLVAWDTRQDRLTKTLDMLLCLPSSDEGFDASPIALNRLVEDRAGYQSAIPPPPRRRRLETPLIDLWAMTSLPINPAGTADTYCIPEPETFIHGLDETDTEVEVIWRNCPQDRQAEWLSAWPIRRQEVSRLPIGSAKRLFGAGEGTAYLISSDMASVAEIELASLERRLRPGMTLMLPCELGGLDALGLPAKLHKGAQHALDVSIEPGDHVITLELNHEGDEPEWRAIGIEGYGSPDLSEVIPATASRLMAKVVFIDPNPAILEIEESSVSRYTLWLTSLAPQLADETDNASLVRCDRRLDQHLDLAGKAASRISAALQLSADLSAEFIEAARQHDLGKSEIRWQTALGNINPTVPLAKSSRRQFDVQLNDGYRHELGSLRDQNFPPLTAHLIAAHHGWARPIFTEKALRKLGCRAPGEASPARFAHLQTRYGWWGLAYLEALVRCADILAEVLIDELEGDPS